MLKDIGKQILQRRKALNLDINDLSQFSDVTASSISKIENGKLNPTIKTIEKLLIPLGLTLTTIIKEKN
jgi:transcriptional regulator with XRE-family HTH domain